MAVSVYGLTTFTAPASQTFQRERERETVRTCLVEDNCVETTRYIIEVKLIKFFVLFYYRLKVFSLLPSLSALLNETLLSERDVSRLIREDNYCNCICILQPATLRSKRMKRASLEIVSENARCDRRRSEAPILKSIRTRCL